MVNLRSYMVAWSLQTRHVLTTPTSYGTLKWLMTGCAVSSTLLRSRCPRSAGSSTPSGIRQQMPPSSPKWALTPWFSQGLMSRTERGEERSVTCNSCGRLSLCRMVTISRRYSLIYSITTTLARSLYLAIGTD